MKKLDFYKIVILIKILLLVITENKLREKYKSGADEFSKCLGHALKKKRSV